MKTGASMQIKSKSQPLSRRQSGYALIMIMCFIAVSLIIFASTMRWASSNSTITRRNNAFNQAEGAAESASETQLSYMIRDFAYNSLSSASSYTNLLPSTTSWPIQYQFSNVGLFISTINWSPLSGQFTNLNGFVANCTNTITATATTGPAAVPATIQQFIQFASVPVFQYAIFYNMDLEICPGAAMTIGGHVHSNNNIYYTGDSSSQPLTFGSLVDSSGFSTNSRDPNDPQSWTAGNVNFNVANQPVQNVDSLSMPIGTNNNPAAISAILGFPPSSLMVPNAAAYSATGSVYLINGADLIISNNVGGTNFTVLYDNQNVSPALTSVPGDVPYVFTNPLTHLPATNYYYSYVTNATFYDYRESDTVQAIQINVNNLVVWLTNSFTIGGTNRGGLQYNNLNSTSSTSKGHKINSIYVYNSVPFSTTVLPAVRLVNGQQLPSAGLTVATPDPIYVKGNYNIQTNAAGTPSATGLYSTTNGAALPAAFMGDAVTILSGNWSDSYSNSTALTSRTPTATTINAACLEGIVPSVTASGTKEYSGGVENFLRMEENWSGSIPLTYNGSIVVMFPSQYATNYWQSPGVYYNPPQRNWGFDVNFLKGQAYLPPLTPQAKYVIRASWAAW
jgi:hypothetical protein